MKIEDFEKSKKELEKIKEKNNEKLLVNEKRFRIANTNQLEYKTLIALFFSVLGYIGLFMTTASLIKLFGISTISNALSWLSYPGVFIGISLGIGTITGTLFNKKLKNKDRLKEFSTAKTQLEKLEEEIHYQMELEKINNRNKAIDETIKLLDSNQAMLNKVSSRYDLIDKEAPKSEEEAKQKSIELSTIIKEQYGKLDLLASQKVLHERFWRVRQKDQRRIATIIASMMSGTFVMGFSCFPIILFSGFVEPRLEMLLTPFVIGVASANMYMIKRNKDYQKTFSNLNNRLGENALADNLDQNFDSALEECKELEALIETQIKDISSVEVQLQENKRYLDAYLIEENKKVATLDNISNVLAIEKRRQEDFLYLDTDENYSENDLDKNLSSKGNGYTLAKRRKWAYIGTVKKPN